MNEIFRISWGVAGRVVGRQALHMHSEQDTDSATLLFMLVKL